MPDTTAQPQLGLFSNPPSINIGNPYGSRAHTADARSRGKQMTTQPTKKGKTPDVTFSKFETLAVGDPYVEMAVKQRRDRNEKLKQQIVPVPFRPANPSRRATGHGSHYGTFSLWPNIKTSDDYDKRPVKKGEKDLAPKNIVTSPPRKGTYGFVGTNMGGRPEGVMGEYKYAAEPLRPRPATAPDGEKLKAFIPSSPAKKGTYGYLQLNINGASKPHGSQGEYTYVADPLTQTQRSRNDDDGNSLKPFKPSNPPKKGRGYYGTFRWGGQEYKEDPEKEKAEKQIAERKAARERNMGLIFLPCSHSKSTRTSSVANHPRNQDGGHPAAVNARLFMARNPPAGGGGGGGMAATQ